MIRSEFNVQGMTCGSCEATLTKRLSALPGVASVRASREKESVEIDAARSVAIDEVRQALTDLPKYSVRGSVSSAQPSAPAAGAAKSFYEIYRPLFTLFAFVLIVSFGAQLRLGIFDPHLLMNHVMAGLFIGLSFFKFLDLRAFAESFAGYDPIAQRWSGYGYVYPFIELGLGILFVAGALLPLANLMTILVLSVTTVGVYRRVRSKSRFQCACLGTTFNLPLSNVTIAENSAMILMAIWGLVG